MRIDLYTRTVLTLIALLLAVIAVLPLVHPGQTVQAQGSFNGIQFTGMLGYEFWLFDSRSGDAWLYDLHSDAVNPVQHFKVSAPGKPLVK